MDKVDTVWILVSRDQRSRDHTCVAMAYTLSIAIEANEGALSGVEVL